ncbi:hypothetical protein DOY81_006265, partial [Sarcophaga bullata]
MIAVFHYWNWLSVDIPHHRLITTNNIECKYKFVALANLVAGSVTITSS